MNFVAFSANYAWMLGATPAAAKYYRALHHPAETQCELLRGYLRANVGTEFGRAHDFDGIRGVADYQSNVPISTYDDYAPAVEKIAAGIPRVLTAEPARYFALSSGSASAEKRIPYTASLLGEFGRAIAPWVVDLFRTQPSLMRGPAYWSITPVGSRPQNSKGGIPVGFDEDSAYVGGLFKRLVDRTLAVPGALRHVDDMASFRYLTLLYLLRARELRMISVWHPSFLQLLLNATEGFWDPLLADIRRGTVTPPGAPAGAQRLRPDPSRAEELKRLGPRAFAEWWPRLALVSAWADAHARRPAAELAAVFPQARLQGKGLISTEAFASLPLNRDGGPGTPLAIRSHFFELLSDSGKAIACHDAQIGSIYTLVVTTGGGLYRYNTQDRVRVTGVCAKTPCIEFLGKQDHVADRFGEKLSSLFVGDQLARLCSDARMRAGFSMLAPEDDAYTLFVATDAPPPPDLASRLDTLLSENPHYRYCRSLGQLGPARVCRIHPRAAETYLAECASRGQRLGNIKPTPLRADSGWARVFAQDIL